MTRAPRVALLVDNPYRDLPGLTLVAWKLAQSDVEAFLVPFNLQVHEIAALAPDFVLSNYLRKNNEASMRSYLQDGIQIGVLPTEGGVFVELPVEAYRASLHTASGMEISPRWRSYAMMLADDAGVRDAVSAYCAWSEDFATYAEHAGWYRAEQLVVTGAPRMDFYAKPWKASVRGRSGYVDEYGRPLVLINGSFPLVNPRFQTPEQEARQLVERFGFEERFVEHICDRMRKGMAGMVALTNPPTSPTPAGPGPVVR